MQILDIAFTGYSVTDMPRAKALYEGVLGLKKSRGFGQTDGEDQWVEYDIGPGCLALISGGGKDWPPSPEGTAAALEVDDFQGYVDKMRAAGVKFIFDPMESPVCWMATVADPDGNRVLIHKRKPKSA
jgi:predicted enzyme related to lactoylglutathione lyase